MDISELMRIGLFECEKTKRKDKLSNFYSLLPCNSSIEALVLKSQKFWKDSSNSPCIQMENVILSKSFTFPLSVHSMGLSTQIKANGLIG